MTVVHVRTSARGDAGASMSLFDPTHAGVIPIGAGERGTAASPTPIPTVSRTIPARAADVEER